MRCDCSRHFTSTNTVRRNPNKESFDKCELILLQVKQGKWRTVYIYIYMCVFYLINNVLMHAHTHVYIYICVCVCICVSLSLFVYIYIYTVSCIYARMSLSSFLLPRGAHADWRLCWLWRVDEQCHGGVGKKRHQHLHRLVAVRHLLYLFYCRMHAAAKHRLS